MYFSKFSSHYFIKRKKAIVLAQLVFNRFQLYLFILNPTILLHQNQCIYDQPNA